MNTTAEYEIDVALLNTNKWLDAIELGRKPSRQDMPTKCVRLYETSKGLSLIKWSPLESQLKCRLPTRSNLVDCLD